ncbi:MAG: glycosyltransferase family 2 protein, partial [Planctomyces sp.]
MQQASSAVWEIGWKKMTDQQPLLSICIPTCNRAGFLRVMLQALLPQVSQFPGQVEVWVLDNASTDKTDQVLAESVVLGPFRVHRQHQNIGPTRNIVCGPATLANGEYVWVLGDHNLLRPGALSRLLTCLKQHRSHGVFYVNFLAASFPSQWPEEAVGGYDGEFQYLGNPEVRSGIVSRWYHLLRPHSSACTQNYVHIVSTKIWRDFWQDGVQGSDYSSALTTYPHTMTIIKTACNQPAVVMADPMITIFNGAQSWSDPQVRLDVWSKGLTDMLNELKRHGVPVDLRELLWRDLFKAGFRTVVAEVVRSKGVVKGLWFVGSRLGGELNGWIVLLQLMPDILFPRLCNRIRSAISFVRNYQSWYVCNFRPARWLRSWLMKP